MTPRFCRIFDFLTLALIGSLLSCQPPASSSVASSNAISSEIQNLDLISPGPFKVQHSLYGRQMVGTTAKDLDTREDPLVLPGRTTDLRGAIWMPKAPSGQGRYPLIILLHGNHGTCRQKWRSDEGARAEDSLFSENGACSPGYEEIPSYLGYDYLARAMASHGFIVVSINANRGITGWDMVGNNDPWLIEARGRLVLKHLAWLRDWDSGVRDSKGDTDIDLKGKIDFGHVGLMGHSRGGEGVRAAISLYQAKDPQSYAKRLGSVTFEGVLEFAPVDLYGSRPHNAPSVNWTVVIASCDGDITDLQGTGTFRRRRLEGAQDKFSSIFVVPGANHNFFNTEWQSSDSENCGPNTKLLFSPKATASAAQQQVGLLTSMAFFRGFVAGDPNAERFRKVFDPQYQVPTQLSQLLSPIRESFQHNGGEQVDLAHSASTTRGVKVSAFTEAFGPEKVGSMDIQRARRRVLSVTWDRPSLASSLDLHFSKDNMDLRQMWILSLGFARYQKCFVKDEDKSCDSPSPTAPNVSISLIMADDSISAPVQLLDYAALSATMNEHLTNDQCSSPFVFNTTTAQCVSHEVGNALKCKQIGGFWPGDGQCVQNFTQGFQHALLFQEVPIELKDFKGARLDAVKGVRLTFDRSPGTTLLLDQTMTLRRISEKVARR